MVTESSRRAARTKEEKPTETDKEKTAREAEAVEEKGTPPTPVIYEVVRHHGEIEMARPSISLWWSAVAAGLSISFSLLAEAILQSHLPDAPWRHLVSNLGYSVGFVMVILSRQQLFTENTITVVLPLMAAPTPANLGRLARNWSVVFAGNMAGTLGAALFCTFTPVLQPELFDTMLDLSREAMTGTWSSLFFGGISAGFLIATMVWLAPSTGSAQVLVIILMTWLIAVGDFAHIVAGSVEAFLLVLGGELGVGSMIVDFTIPVLLGNIVGGTVLFAVLSYAQVMSEI